MAKALVKVLEQALKDHALLGRRKPADAARLAGLEKKHRVRLPDDFRETMHWSDGFGTTSRQTQLNLFDVEDLALLNTQDDVVTYLPGMFVIGNDGGGALYFYDPKNALGKGAYAVFLVPQGAIGFDDAMFAGASLTDVVQSVLNDESFFDRPCLKEEPGYRRPRNAPVPRRV